VSDSAGSDAIPYHAGPLLHERISSINSTVPAIDTAREPRQPRRLEKNPNIPRTLHARCQRVAIGGRRREMALDLAQRQREVFFGRDT
jgi:hypothetical protein